MKSIPIPAASPPPPSVLPAGASTAFGCPRDFLDNRFVYTVVSPRARGLSVGINMNPDRHCNFDCVYCEVKRDATGRGAQLDVEDMALELQLAIDLVQSGRIRERPNYRGLPDELLKLRHVALSGDGERRSARISRRLLKRWYTCVRADASLSTSSCSSPMPAAWIARQSARA